jgi:hypothetical protein
MSSFDILRGECRAVHAGFVFPISRTA